MDNFFIHSWPDFQTYSPNRKNHNMKKLLLSSLVLAAITTVNAQTTFLDENFEGGAMPSGWTQSSAGASSDGWIVGTSTALESASWGIPPHTTLIATNDDGCGQ